MFIKTLITSVITNPVIVSQPQQMISIFVMTPSVGHDTLVARSAHRNKGREDSGVDIGS